MSKKPTKSQNVTLVNESAPAPEITPKPKKKSIIPPSEAKKREMEEGSAQNMTDLLNKTNAATFNSTKDVIGKSYEQSGAAKFVMAPGRFIATQAASAYGMAGNTVQHPKSSAIKACTFAAEQRDKFIEQLDKLRPEKPKDNATAEDNDTAPKQGSS